MPQSSPRHTDRRECPALSLAPVILELKTARCLAHPGKQMYWLELQRVPKLNQVYIGELHKAVDAHEIQTIPQSSSPSVISQTRRLVNFKYFLSMWRPRGYRISTRRRSLQPHAGGPKRILPVILPSSLNTRPMPSSAPPTYDSPGIR